MVEATDQDMIEIKKEWAHGGPSWLVHVYREEDGTWRVFTQDPSGQPAWHGGMKTLGEAARVAHREWTYFFDAYEAGKYSSYRQQRGLPTRWKPGAALEEPKVQAA